MTGPKARGLWFMFGCLCVLAGFVTAGRAATRPPAAAYQPNRTSDLHVIIAELDKLTPFRSEVSRDKQGRRWSCKMADDAPTRASLDRTAAVYWCSLVPKPKPKPKA